MKKIASIFAVPALTIVLSASTALAAREASDSTIAKEYLAGEYAAKDNNYEEASRLFSTALAKNPDNKFLLQNTYKFMLLAGHYDMAANYARKYLEYDKNSVNAALLLATYSASKGEYAAASSLLEGRNTKVKGKKPVVGVEQLLIPFVRVWISAGEGNYDVALSSLDPHDMQSIVSTTFINLQRALLYSLSGDKKQAELKFTDLVSQKGILPYHLVKSAGSFYESIGKWDEAGKVYEKYRAQHPAVPRFENAAARLKTRTASGLYIKTPNDGMAEVMKEAARLLFTSEVYNEGLMYLRMALMLKPDDEEANMLLANYQEEHKDWQAAIDIYNKIPENSDIYSGVLVNKAEDLYSLGKKSEAEDLLLGEAKKSKEKYIPLVTLADILRRDNEFKKAAKIYTMVLDNIDQKSPASWAIFFARGICYERSDNWKQAESDLLTALQLSPNQPEASNYLAYSWIERNENLEQASKMLLKAVAKRPEDPQILDSAGWALYKMKDYKNAVILLEKAGEMLPQDAVMNDHLGDTYWRLGRHYEARYQWQRAIKYGPAESSSVEKLNQKIEQGLGQS